jgi:hypothetical protein
MIHTQPVLRTVNVTRYITLWRRRIASALAEGDDDFKYVPSLKVPDTA